MIHAGFRPSMLLACGFHAQRQHPAVATVRTQEVGSLADKTGVTPAVWIYVWTSLFLGFMMGYSFSSSLLLQISQSYLSMFFPETLEQYQSAGAPGFATSHTSARYVGSYVGNFGVKWCAYDDPKFEWVLASRYFAAAVSTAGAAGITHYCGRRAAILVAVCVYLMGTVLFASAFQLAQLIIGNLLIGVSTGIIYVSIVVGNVEIAPTRRRGGLTGLNLVGATLGFTCGICVYWAKDMRFSTHGWRIAVALGGWPAIIVLLLYPWLPETPDSLIQRGKLAEGREALERVRGPFCNINQEITSIWWSATGGRSSDGVPSIWQQLRLLQQPCHFVPVVVCCLLALCREFVGIFVLVPLMPQLLDGVHPFGSSEPQLWQAGLMLHACTVIGGLAAVLLMDVIGRRPLLLSAGVVGVFGWATLAGLMGTYGSARAVDMHNLVPLVLTMAALISAANGWSLYSVWGSITAESQMLCVRTSAVAVCAGFMLLMRAVVQVALQVMMCRMQWKILTLAAVAYVLCIVVTAVMLPETNQVPLGDMSGVWTAHWLWRHWLKRKSTAPARGPHVSARHTKAMV